MKYLKIYLSVLLFFGFYSIAFALPTINSFIPSNTSAMSGQLISFSWSGQDTSGYNLLIACQLGVKVKNQDGSIFPCDTKVPTSNLATSISLYLINISGSNKTVTFSLYPKSTAGDEYTSGVVFQTVTLSPASVPISDFSTSASSTISGVPVTLSWTSPDLDGVNLFIPCVDGVTATSSVDSTVLSCGQTAFANKLSGSGSVSLMFKNANADRRSVDVRVIPYIGNGMYDGVHFQTITFDVASDKVSPSQILTFLPSKSALASDDNVDIIWTTKNVNGVNLRMDCNSFLTTYLVSSSSKQAVRCGAVMFDNALGANASSTFVFYNSSNDKQYANFTLLPQFSYGGYDGLNTRTISIPVLPKGQAVVYSQNFTPSQTSAVVSAINTSANVSSAKSTTSPRKKFLKSLSLGSRGDDVSALQEFLLKNGYYPNGSVTGYFGSLTAKAVGKFQEDKNVAKKGGAGYGNVGPATRAKLNSL